MTDPKNPQWYSEAFDNFQPVLQDLVDRDKVIADGYDLPDADGAKSSIDYSYASTNNTFDPTAVQSSLKDLYLNSSHKLTANSHDNSHFFRWEGDLSAFEKCDNLSQWYQITLPWNVFIYQEDRDRFKWSQFDHRWIKADEILNNWDVFRWALLVFVDRRAASNYEVWVEEQSFTFRIRVASDWIKAKLPVYLYRFDTGFQARVKVSYRELADQFHWDYPFANLGDNKAKGLQRLILSFNLVLDETEPVLDRVISETLGDNLEFVQVDPEKRSINVGQITPVNVNYLMSKQDSMFWMTIISPKFFHEYPVLLCSDVIYRPWLPSMEPLMTMKQNLPFRVKGDLTNEVIISDDQRPWRRALRDENGKLVWETKKVIDANGNEILDIFGQPVTKREKVLFDEYRLHRHVELPYPHQLSSDESSIKQFYVNRTDRNPGEYDGWFTVTRPVVLSDAFTTTVEPYDLIRTEIETLRFDLINFTKTTDEFALYIDNESRKNAENWLKWISLLDAHGTEAYNGYAKWYDRRQCPRDQVMEAAFKTYFQYLTDLRGSGDPSDPVYAPWLNVSKLPSAWFANIRQILADSYKLFDRFPLTDVIGSLPRKLLWYVDDEFTGKQRFNRPVDASDFLIMEYDQNRQVWRPRARKITHHFPDVYTIEPLEGEAADPNGIYKAFFFYSDTINVNNPVSEPTVSKPQFDEELTAYQTSLGNFKQIFMEKFYWLALKSLYQGLMVTGSRWEVIEFTLENDSYRRFNELFLKTSDPYFKLGLATYLSGSNNEFPFDDAIAKLKEQMKLKWQGYEKVTSFEYYLRAQWSQSYFDYLEKITDDFNISDQVRQRPPITFNLNKLLAELDRILKTISYEISTALKWTLSTKILPSEGGIVESEVIDVSVNSYRNKLAWVVNELTTNENYGLNIDLVKYLSVLLNGLPQGLERVIHYLADRDPDIYSIGELMTIVPWLSGFELAVDETENSLEKVSAELIAKSSWQLKLDLTTECAKVIGGQLRALAKDIFREIIVLNLAMLNKIIDAEPYTDKPDTSSVLAVMRQLDYPWSNEVRQVYGQIASTVKLLNEIYVPYRSLSELEIVNCQKAIETLGSELLTLRQNVTQYWQAHSIVPVPKLIAALDAGDDLTGVYRMSIARYLDYVRSAKQISTGIIEAFNAPDGLYLSMTEQTLYIDPLQIHLQQLDLYLTQLWSEPAETDIDQQLQVIQDIFENWKLYLDQEKHVFDILHEIVETPELMLQLRLEVRTVGMIVTYLKSLPSSFQPDTMLPDYTEIYQVTELGIISPGARYEVGEIIHVPQIGSIAVSSVGELGDVTSIGQPVHFSAQFRNPTGSTSYHSISEGSGFGLTVNCLHYDSAVLIDNDLAAPVITELRVVSRNLTEFSSTINPTSNIEMIKVIARLSSITAKWDNVNLHYGSNITEELKSNVGQAISVLASSEESVKAFVENRESLDLRELLVLSSKLTDILVSLNHSASAEADVIYNKISDYFGYGTGWSDRDQLENLISEIQAFVAALNAEPALPEKLFESVVEITAKLNDITIALANFQNLSEQVQLRAAAIISSIDEYDLSNPFRSTAYQLDRVSVANAGEDYVSGDIVKLTDHAKDYIFIISRAEHGQVMSVKPLIEYALAERTWGCMLVDSCGNIGVGHSLTLTIRSSELRLSTLIPPSGHFTASANTVVDRGENIDLDATISTSATPDQFGPSDLAIFKFSNIHDLDMNYEIFIGGHQLTDFFQRHERSEDPDNPSKLDCIYVDANLVNSLKLSNLIISPENYFIYKLQGLVIVDPGVGYHRDQRIYLNANEVCLELNVVSLERTPFKGIAELELADSNYIFERTDPGGTHLLVVPDDMCNVDDEFHVNNFDRLTKTGQQKPLLLGENEPTYLSQRPETVNNGEIQPEVDDRNATFMYPTVGKPLYPFPPDNAAFTVSPQVLSSDGGIVQAKLTSETDPIDPNDLRGDPEYGWYQGHRIDNSFTGQTAKLWEGIADSEEVTDRVVGDSGRQPPEQPVKGEYQLIGRCRMHNMPVDDSPDTISDPRNNTGVISRYNVDHTVQYHEELPHYPGTLTDGNDLIVGQTILVLNDVSHDNHSWLYRVREMSPTGCYRYDEGTIYDDIWNTFTVDWLRDDSYPELPNTRQTYPGIGYHDDIRTWYGGVEIPVLRQEIQPDTDLVPKTRYHSSYIHMLTVDDIAVFNRTTRLWEDLHDKNLWKLEVNSGTDSPLDAMGCSWGFRLTYLNQDAYSYDMKLYLAKIPRNQMLAQSLVKPAAIDVIATIDSEVAIEAQRLPVNTSRTVRIRKLFPYRQSMAIGLLPDDDVQTQRSRIVRGILSPEGTKFFSFDSSTKFLPPSGGNLEMNVKMIPCSVGVIYFTLAQYMHYRNQVHLGDLKLFNHTEHRFENLLDPNEWQVDLGSDVDGIDELVINDFDAIPKTLRNEGGLTDVKLDATKQARHHSEKQTKVVETIIIDPGKSFEHGFTWGYNREFDLHIYGTVTSAEDDDGHILTFHPTHFPVKPKSGIYTFELYQKYEHGVSTAAKVTVEFMTETVEVEDDGYLKAVTNPMAPVKKNVRITPKHPKKTFTIYEIFIDLTAKRFNYLTPAWQVNPTISIEEWQCQEERWYLLVDGIRFPLVNPSTGKRTLRVNEHSGGVDVTFMNVSRAHERLEFRTLPYPIRSAYTQRKIPRHGYLDLSGKLNKPLGRDYYEFWVNGKLLADEVTIITPTKLFLHGLTSLRNLEIVEINRDPHEYFSDTFLKMYEPSSNPRPHPLYDMKTYLDGALEGSRMGDEAFDIYTLGEQAKLLEPVWEQVTREHPEYRNYPENVDTDADILVRLFDEDLPLPDELPDNSYELMILDAPKLEGVELSARDMKWSDFKLKPIDDHQIISMLNDEWQDEITNDPYLREHFIISDEEWYGRSARLYDEFGNRVYSLRESFYHVIDHDHLLNINTSDKSVRLEQSPYTIDLDQLNDSHG